MPVGWCQFCYPWLRIADSAVCCPPGGGTRRGFDDRCRSNCQASAGNANGYEDN